MLQANSLVGVRARYESVMYTDICNIYNQHKTKVNGVTKLESVKVVENQPCRISFSNFPKVSQTEAQANVEGDAKLFISPDIEVLEGSRVEVSREGKTLYFKATGTPSTYPTHQEIKLEISERWA